MPDFQRIRDSVRIEDVVAARGVALSRQGASLVGRCPFHEDKGRPNLVVFPATQTYCCFVCGARGDAVDFVARTEGVSQGEAARRLADAEPSAEAAARIPAPAQAADLDRRDLVYRTLLAFLDLAASDRDTLMRRGLSDVAVFSAGYRTLPTGAQRDRATAHLTSALGPDGMRGVPGFGLSRGAWTLRGPEGVVIPVCDERGRIAALQVRTGDASRRYRWLSAPGAFGGASSGAPAHVSRPSLAKAGPVWLTEGALKADVLAWRLGVCAVAAPGVALWRRALPSLSALGARTVVLAFDQDEDPATARAVGRHTREASREIGRTRRVRHASWQRGKGVDDALALGEEVRVR